MDNLRIGALEAGGTKMVCAIGNERGEIFEQISIPTETPEITMPQLISYFKERHINSLGIACFGPINLNRNSNTYGYITSTPKLSWRNYDFLNQFKKELNIPVGFDTDVNGSALGEQTFGCMKGLNSGIYITIGTGIGVGIIVEGKLLHGMVHPEGGHILLSKHPKDTYRGKCPYHFHCFEGLASGPAIEDRYGEKAYRLQDQAGVWEMEAYYIGQAIADYILVLSPERIVLGGGVMHQKQLFPLIRQEVAKILHGYVNSPQMENLDNYIVPSSLNDNQGILGCLQLAVNELKGLV